MDRESWLNLNIGDVVFLIKNPTVILTVSEICTEERFLQNWITRGHTDVVRLIKFDGENNFHTWSVENLKWDLQN